MKKTIMTIAAALFAASAAFAQVNVGAGYNGIAHTPSEGDTQWYHGAYVQLGYNYKLKAGFELMPSIQYSFSTMHDAHVALPVAPGVALDADSHSYDNYLNVPLMVGWGHEFGENCRLFIYAGPTPTFGLYANNKMKFDATPLGGSADYTKNTELYAEGSDYERWDVKVGGGIGVDIFRHYRLTVGYDYGLINRYRGDADLKIHTQTISAAVAYLF